MFLVSNVTHNIKPQYNSMLLILVWYVYNHQSRDACSVYKWDSFDQYVQQYGTIKSETKNAIQFNVSFFSQMTIAKVG